MTRRGKRGTDGAQDEGPWLDRPWDQTEPPWELPGWDDSGPAGRRRRERDLAPGHPSGPLPPLSSGPLPRLPDDSPGPLPDDHQDWLAPPPRSGGGRGAAPPEAGPGYQGRHGGRHFANGYDEEGDGHAAGGYPDDGYGAGYAGSDRYTGYPPSGYQDAAYPGGELPPPEFPGGEYAYPPQDYPGSGHPGDSGGYPMLADYPSGPGFETGDHGQAGGYPGEEYGEHAGYGDGAGYGEYAAEAAYQGEPPGSSGDQYRDDSGDPGYHPSRSWYGDVDDEHGWAEDDYGDDAFLPGLTSATDTRRREAAPGRDRAPRGGKVKPVKRKRGLRRIMPWLAVAVLLLVLGTGGGAYYYVWHTYLHPPDYSGAGTGNVTVQIKQGDTATIVGQRLQQLGIVASARAFANAAKNSGKGTALEPGYYRLHRHMSAALAFALLLKPSSRVQLTVTIPEGLRLSDIISRLGKASGDLSAYQQAIKDTSALELPAAAHGSPQGYLFPATYTIQPGTKPLRVLRTMVLRFDQEAADLNMKTVAAHDQMTEAQVVTVASLIQAEGRRLADFPKIAEVIYNRLNSNMKLQLDSTVLFALNKYGILATNAQLQVKSPYNTYQHLGLPPGPIDSPGTVALKAALHPAHGSYLYFVTVNPKTGLTRFTSDPAVFAQYKNELEKALAKG